MNLTKEQVAALLLLIECAYDLGFARTQLVTEIMKEFKCSGMFAGDCLNAAITSKYNLVTRKWFDRYHHTGSCYFL